MKICEKRRISETNGQKIWLKMYIVEQTHTNVSNQGMRCPDERSTLMLANTCIFRDVTQNLTSVAVNYSMRARLISDFVYLLAAMQYRYTKQIILNCC